MTEIKIFSAKWDKNFNEVIFNIKKVLTEKGIEGKVKVRIFDIDNHKNIKPFESYTIKMERKVGIPENPARAVPLVVIDEEPFSLGMNPDFKDNLMKRL